jgi:methyl-accepting chemotaxis protein
VKSRQIGDIITTVQDLAERSHLLALIASVEAAKAGDHGPGFVVVAMEMRNLAEQSSLAAGQVRGILGELQKGTEVAVSATGVGRSKAEAAAALAREAGNIIRGLTQVSRESSLAAKQIASNTRQQTVGVEQIVSAVSEQSRATSEAVEGTHRIEHVATNLSKLSGRLSELVQRYDS